MAIKIHFEGSRGPSVAAGPGVAYPPDPLSTALLGILCNQSVLSN